MSEISEAFTQEKNKQKRNVCGKTLNHIVINHVVL